MRHFRQPDIFRPCLRKQHGAALMVMLVIMIIGAAAILVSSLSSSAIKIDRDKATSDALAKAKEALIGRALADDNRPGSLPCPDTNDDGSSDTSPSGNCYSYTGRLPWRTLGLTDLRDGSGERLWYALSLNFRDASSNHINSDTQGTLAISGTSSASSIIAIVFAPGAAISGTNRSPSTTAACSASGTTVAQSLCATNYLEGSNAALNTGTNPNLNYQSAGTSSTFNDRMIFITHKDLMPLVEKRIAREAITCLENYASTYFNRYPWAAPVTDITNYISTDKTLFGRLPKSVIYSDVVKQLMDDLAALQNSLNAYNATPSAQANIDALGTAGSNLANYAQAQNPATADPFDQGSLTKFKNAGATVTPLPSTDWSAQKVSTYVNQVQGAIDLAITFVLSTNHGGTTIGGWPSGCQLVPSTYWADWKNQVFYQIANSYAPVSNCTTGNLTINGAGSYHATVIVAGEMLQGQTRTSTSDIQAPNNYLANTSLEIDPSTAINAHTSTGTCPTTNFIKYKPADSNYRKINDLVLCLDGSSSCK